MTRIYLARNIRARWCKRPPPVLSPSRSSRPPRRRDSPRWFAPIGPRPTPRAATLSNPTPRRIPAEEPLARLALGVTAYEQKDYAAAISALAALPEKLPLIADYPAYYLGVRAWNRARSMAFRRTSLPYTQARYRLSPEKRGSSKRARWNLPPPRKPFKPCAITTRICRSPMAILLSLSPTRPPTTCPTRPISISASTRNIHWDPRRTRRPRRSRRSRRLWVRVTRSRYRNNCYIAPIASSNCTPTRRRAPSIRPRSINSRASNATKPVCAWARPISPIITPRRRIPI